jgi:hypothetical protein
MEIGMRARRLFGVSAVLIGLVALGGTSNASGSSPVSEAAQLRAATAHVVSTTHLGATTATIVRDAAGTYTVLDVNRAPGRIAYLVRGNVLTGATNTNAALAWRPGHADRAQQVPFAQPAAAVPAGCSHWMLGPFGSYGYQVADSSTSCNAKQALMQNSASLWANNASTSLDFDQDQNVNVSYLSSRATHLCNGSTWTPWRAGSSWRIVLTTGETNSGWQGRSCGY